MHLRIFIKESNYNTSYQSEYIGDLISLFLGTHIIKGIVRQKYNPFCEDQFTNKFLLYKYNQKSPPPEFPIKGEVW